MNNKQLLINKIYQHTPPYSSGLNSEGDRIIGFNNGKMYVQANLERLTLEQLNSLALMLNIKVSRKKVAQTTC